MKQSRSGAEYRVLLRGLLFLVVLTFAGQGRGLSFGIRPQGSINELEARLKSQYATIEKVIAAPPSGRQYRVPADYKRRLREWQDDLAQSFAAAGATISEILKLNPPNPEFWQERLETMQLYSQPVGPPETRTVFGSGEIQKSAQIREMSAADSTAAARAAKAKGDVRLRIVLATDGKVKYVFPIKSLGYGLTESAINAARQIKFEPALRNGKPASEFFTVVYEFKNGEARPPYIPKTVF
jgi:TonB family protein